MKWAIQVVDADGNILYVRDGARIGEGPVSQFNTKTDAQYVADTLRGGLSHDEQLSIVLYGGPTEDTVMG